MHFSEFFSDKYCKVDFKARNFGKPCDQSLLLSTNVLNDIYIGNIIRTYVLTIALLSTYSESIKCTHT